MIIRQWPGQRNIKLPVLLAYLFFFCYYFWLPLLASKFKQKEEIDWAKRIHFRHLFCLQDSDLQLFKFFLDSSRNQNILLGTVSIALILQELLRVLLCLYCNTDFQKRRNFCKICWRGVAECYPLVLECVLIVSEVNILDVEFVKTY